MLKHFKPFQQSQSTGQSAGPHTAITAEAPEQLAIINQVEVCYQLAETKLKRRFKRPEINFKLRGKSAGTAHLQLNKLRFNPQLLKENQQAFLDDVVPHEICHLLAYQLYGRVKPHGKEWQGLMYHLYQRTPNTTHNFNTQSVQSKSFDYQCGCGTVALSIRRHNKVLRGQAEYRCRNCRQLLKPI